MRISDWSSDVCSSDLLEVALHEYLPFTILLLSLFTVAGGVRIVGNLHGSPSLNTGLLAAGTVLASWMGTTGAAMLLVRPRSEEHTSELQSLMRISYDVFCLNKKNNTHTLTTNTRYTRTRQRQNKYNNT